jgi:hypothetical protein
MVSVPHRTWPIDWTGVTLSIRAKFEGQVAAVCRSEQECQDLVAFFMGDAAFCPAAPILLTIPGTGAVGATVVVGAGCTTVAELRDLCVTTWGRMVDRLRANGGVMFDFDALRERHGLARREEADAIVRQAMWDRTVRHKRSMRTDPPRDPISEQNPRRSHPTTETGEAAWPL